jgi:hypothetical protein
MGNKRQQEKGQGLKLLVLHCGPINKSIAGGYHLWGFFFGFDPEPFACNLETPSLLLNLLHIVQAEVALA